MIDWKKRLESMPDATEAQRSERRLVMEFIADQRREGRGMTPDIKRMLDYLHSAGHSFAVIRIGQIEYRLVNDCILATPMRVRE